MKYSDLFDGGFTCDCSNVYDYELMKEKIVYLCLWHGVLRSPEFQKKLYQNRINYIGHVLHWRSADSLAAKYYLNSLYGRMCRLNLNTVYGLKG